MIFFSQPGCIKNYFDSFDRINAVPAAIELYLNQL